MDTRTEGEELPFGLVDIRTSNGSPFQPPQIYSFSIPTPDVTPPMTRVPTPPLPRELSTRVFNWTYSLEETTFARRLNRAALEAGFHMLNSRNVRPAKVKHVFKLSLAYLTLDEMRERFRMILSRGTSGRLDFEGLFTPPGGAGTHYPRKGARQIARPWTVSAMGPIRPRITDIDNIQDPNLDMTGFEGEWFDPEDVQGYLEEEKGCLIDPRGSFAEVMVDDDESVTDSVSFSKTVDTDFSTATRRPPPRSDSEGSSNYSSGTDSISSSLNTTSSDLQAVYSHSDTFGFNMGVAGGEMSRYSDLDISAMFDQPLGLDLASGYGLNAYNSTDFSTSSFTDTSSLDLDMASVESGLTVVKQKQKKAALVDISKLIDELVKAGVCLGRVPGFRRKDVDRAFQASLISAF